MINAFLKLLFRRLDFLSKLVVLELFKPSNSTPNEEREQGNEGSNHRIVLCLSDAVLLGQIVPVLSEMNAKQVDNLWKVLIQLDINIITERQSKTETICALSNAFLKCDIEGLFDWVEECGDTLPPNFQKLEMKNPRLEFGRHQRERSQRRNELKRERTLRREAEHSNELQNANIQINFMRASSDISINNAFESMVRI